MTYSVEYFVEMVHVKTYESIAEIAQWAAFNGMTETASAPDAFGMFRVRRLDGTPIGTQERLELRRTVGKMIGLFPAGLRIQSVELLPLE